MWVPEEIKCHNNAPGIYARPEFMKWRMPFVSEPYSYSFMTCGYCGSIHPGDLLNNLEKAATIELADMKYGWPHKFYVHGIPNQLAGQKVKVGSSSYPVFSCTRCNAERSGEHFCPKLDDTCERCHAGTYNFKRSQTDDIIGDAPLQTFAKFYSVHLTDLDGHSFTVLARLISQKTGVIFTLIDGALKWVR